MPIPPSSEPVCLLKQLSLRATGMAAHSILIAGAPMLLASLSWVDLLSLDSFLETEAFSTRLAGQFDHNSESPPKHNESVGIVIAKGKASHSYNARSWN